MVRMIRASVLLLKKNESRAAPINNKISGLLNCSRKRRIPLLLREDLRLLGP